MRDFLKQSELTERKAFIQSFVKEIVVMPGDALLRYTVPMPSDSMIPGKAIEKLALNDPVLVSVHRSPPTETRTTGWRARRRVAYSRTGIAISPTRLPRNPW